MRIIIDLQSCQSESRFRGIGRLSLALSKAIVKNKGKHEVIIALSGLFPDTVEPIRDEFQGLIPQSNIRVWHAPGPTLDSSPKSKINNDRAELIREAFFESLEPDVILIASLFEGYLDNAVASIKQLNTSSMTVTILYDLIPLVFPRQYSNCELYQNHYSRKTGFLRRSDHLLSISNSTKQEAIKTLDFPSSKITTIMAATDSKFRVVLLEDEERNSLKKDLGIKKGFLLYVPGGFDFRKNFDSLFAAYALLPKFTRESHQLVITSKITQLDETYLRALMQSNKLMPEEVILTGYLPDDVLIELYGITDLFVFPSLHEGFGLPVLEAMACGAPTIASNISSLPEVIGNADALFDPCSPESIAEKMEEVLSSPELKKDLRNKGIKRAKCFSWERSAGLTISALENIIEARSNSSLGSKVALKPSDKDRAPPLENLLNLLAAHKLVGLESADLPGLSVEIAKTFPDGMHKKQLLVDLSEIVFVDCKSGIQRVVRAQFLALLNSPPKGFCVKPVYLCEYSPGCFEYRHAAQYMSSLLGSKNSSISDSIVAVKNGDLLYMLDLNSGTYTSAHASHVFRDLKSQGVNIVALLYDLLPVIHPQWFLVEAEKNHIEYLRAILMFSDAIIGISSVVASDLCKWIKAQNFAVRPSLKITHNHLGADLKSSAPSIGLPDDAADTLRCLSSSMSVLMVGTVEPRKAHYQSLKAFELLWEQNIDINLVIVGRFGWNGQNALENSASDIDGLSVYMKKHPELGRRLFLLTGISDEYLCEVYKASTCLLCASQGEGFGLSLIEAAQYKIPIIVRDIPVFREVAGEHAYFFKDSLDEKQLADAISSWLVLYEKNKHPRSDDMPWLTWEQSTEQLKEILMAVHNEAGCISSAKERIMTG